MSLLKKYVASSPVEKFGQDSTGATAYSKMEAANFTVKDFIAMDKVTVDRQVFLISLAIA